jgi:predicted secreted protein
MTVLAGKAGKVTLGANFVAEIKGWKVNLKADTKETTPMATDSSTAWKTYLATLKGWEGSIDQVGLDMTDTNGQLAIFNLIGGAATAVKFYLDATHYLSGNVIFTGVSPAATVDGLVEGGGFSFQGTGALTYT